MFVIFIALSTIARKDKKKELKIGVYIPKMHPEHEKTAISGFPNRSGGISGPRFGLFHCRDAGSAAAESNCDSTVSSFSGPRDLRPMAKRRQGLHADSAKGAAIRDFFTRRSQSLPPVGGTQARTVRRLRGTGCDLILFHLQATESLPPVRGTPAGDICRLCRTGCDSFSPAEAPKAPS